MLGYKIFSAGLNSMLTQAMCQDVATGLTATGTTKADAYEVTTGSAEFTTVASGTGAILSSKATAGDDQWILNVGANPLNVYPTSGAKINALAADQPMLLAVNTSCLFKCFSSTRWSGVLSA